MAAVLPVDVARLTSPYGQRGDEMHAGIDLAAPEGTPVYAYREGTVRLLSMPGQMDGYGLALVIAHADGRYSLYAHLSAAYAMPGQHVQEGELVGAVGRTAGTREDPSKMFGTSGAHLHFELLSKWPPSGRKLDRIDPSEILLDWPNGRVLQSRATKVAAAGGGFVLAAAALWYLSKAKRGGLRTRRAS